jgi:hypothetical protein
VFKPVMHLSEENDSFFRRQFTLLTLHKKEQIIAPIIQQRLDGHVLLTQDYNTDLLGSFDGAVQRTLTPKECALKKAQLATELTGCSLGLGSEGSFGSGPFGFVTFDHELVACVDIEQGWSIVGSAYGPVDVRQQDCQHLQQVDEFLAGVPIGQGLMLTTKDNTGATIISKGLSAPAEVYDQLTAWFGSGFNPLTISYDLRAHQCPARRDRIAEATENLVARLLSACPGCKRPDFWPDHRETGLPCQWCGTPTSMEKLRKSICQDCHHEELFLPAQSVADQQYCPYCNP